MTTLTEIIEMAEEVLLREGQHMPTVMVIGSKKTAMLRLSDLPDTHAGRARRMFSAGRSIAREGVVGKLQQIYFISEGWMSTGEKGKMPDKVPSQDPKRVEVLLISGLNLETTQVDIVVHEMVRDSEGTLIELKALDISGVERADSPLLRAFAQGFQAGSRPKTDDA